MTVTIPNAGPQGKGRLSRFMVKARKRHQAAAIKAIETGLLPPGPFAKKGPKPSILPGERYIEDRGKNSVADFGRGKRDSDERL